MSEWQRHSVTELERAGVLLVQDGNHGNDRPRSHEFVSEGVAFVRAANMTSGRVDFRSASRINDVARNRIRKGVGRPGDVLLSHKGTVGRVAAVPLDAPEFVCSPQTTFWRSLDESRLDRTYLRCFMSSPDFVVQLDSRKGETDMAPYVSLTEQRKLTVVLPPIAEQRAIAGVLGALDDKIESNCRQCRILDELALTTCKKLFQSDLECDRGARLGDVASITLGGTPSRSRPEFWDGGRIAWINSGALHEKPLITASDMITDEGLRRSATEIVPSGSTVVAITGATLGVVSRLGINAAINQSVVGIYVPGSRELTDYIYIWMRLNIARLVSSATGAAQQHVNKSNFEDLLVSIPDETSLRLMGEVSSLLDAQTTLSRQNKSLVALRDSLLPELLSGRLRVRVAEKVVERAV